MNCYGVAYHDKISRLEFVDQEPSTIANAYHLPSELRLQKLNDAIYRYTISISHALHVTSH
jgi:hypothetical protein